MKNKIYVNALVGELVAPISATDTEIRIRALTLGALPTLAEGKWFTISLQEEYSIEVVKVTAVDIGLNTLTVERGFEGTAARQWADGTQWGTRLTATDADAFNNKQDALTKEDVKVLYESNPDTNVFTNVEKTKLGDIAENATANATDAQLRARSSHTGTQAVTTITGLAPIATSGSYNDLSNKPTIPTVPALMPQAEATTGTSTTQRTINAKVLKDTIDASVSTATSPLQSKLTAGTNVQISADNVISSTNTTYAGMSAAEIGAGTATSNRSISSKVLNDWLNGKGYSTQTLEAGSNVSISGNTISSTNTTYTTGTLAQLNTGTDTSGRLQTAKLLNDWLNGKGYVTTDTKYSAGNGITLSGTAFSLPVTVSGSGTYVQSVVQNTNGITVTLGTPPNTNTTYAGMTQAEANAGTSTTNRLISPKVLSDTFVAKRFKKMIITDSGEVAKPTDGPMIIVLYGGGGMGNSGSSTRVFRGGTGAICMIYILNGSFIEDTFPVLVAAPGGDTEALGHIAGGGSNATASAHGGPGKVIKSQNSFFLIGAVDGLAPPSSTSDREPWTNPVREGLADPSLYGFGGFNLTGHGFLGGPGLIEIYY